MDSVIMMISGSIESMHYECTQTTLHIEDRVPIDDSLSEKFPPSPLNSIRISGKLLEDQKMNQLPSASFDPLAQQPRRIPFSNTSALDHLILW